MGWGGATGERPQFLGVDEMQKALREASTQLRETHERNERQLQVVSELEEWTCEGSVLFYFCFCFVCVCVVFFFYYGPPTDG